MKIISIIFKMFTVFIILILHLSVFICKITLVDTMSLFCTVLTKIQLRIFNLISLQSSFHHFHIMTASTGKALHSTFPIIVGLNNLEKSCRDKKKICRIYSACNAIHFKEYTDVLNKRPHYVAAILCTQ